MFTRRLSDDAGNCLLWGCATLVLVAILGTILGGVTIWFQLNELRDKYTETAPVDLPEVEIAEDELEALIERVNDFAEGLREERPMAPLTLSQDELNALLRFHPDLHDFSSHVYLTLEGDSVMGQVSIPLDIMPGFKGRYFNGAATFDVALMNGRLIAFADSATFNGEPVPEELMQSMRGENLLADINEKVESRELIEGLGALAIENGSVTFSPKNVLEEQAV